MSKKRFNISVESTEKPEFSRVVEQCRKAGLKVEQELDAIGVITGITEASRADRLREIPGVTGVEEDREMGPL